MARLKDKDPRVWWCEVHQSFKVNDGSCWAWELELSESFHPIHMEPDCRMVWSRVVLEQPEEEE